MMGDFVLVHSPLVGPSTWHAVAAELRSRGHRVDTPSLAGVFDGDGPYYPKLRDAIRGPGTIVVHSGAGALVPATGVREQRAVFVDALLPHPGRSWFDTAPAELVARLRDLATDGVLPPWHEWFPPGTVEDLLPDRSTRAAFIAELPRLPLAYFTEPAPGAASHAGPQHAAYLRLSDAYDEEAAQAAERGWPVERLDSHHLAPLTDPVTVADVLERL